MASDGETLCANDPNFAAIYSFLKVFGKLHGLEPPTIIKLQEFIENTEEVSDTLKELHLKLLRRALKSAHSNRWEKCMIKFCHQQGHHQEAWEIERFSYKKASTQVKLKVLKYLLEFQFTCHPKFKTAVNAIPSKELRLDPIGRDKSGCVYWLQVDDDANLCLYKEDPDEESWQLIARNREELVKVIAQLKSGEEITPSSTCTENEASSEPEKPHEEPPKSEVDENEEEFLSPESESEHEEIETDKNKQASEISPKEPLKIDTEDNNEQITEEISTNTKENCTNLAKETELSNIPSAEIVPKPSVNESSEDNVICSKDQSSPKVNKVSNDEIDVEKVNNEDTTNIINIECKNESLADNNVNIESETDTNVSDTDDANIENNENEDICSDNEENVDKNVEYDKSKVVESDKPEKLEIKDDNQEQTEEVSEAIEDPVMVVTGEGNGEDCESYFLGEEITEEVMYFYGEGCGYDNDTGNPEAITEVNKTDTSEKYTSKEVINDSKEVVNDSIEDVNDSRDLVNGELDVANTNSSKHCNMKSKSVAKRTLKKQPNDNNDTNPDTKKPCVRDDKTPISETDLNKEAMVNDKSTTDNESPSKSKEAGDSTSPKKSNIKKRRTKVKKKVVARKIKVNDVKEAINSVSETDNVQDKTSIIEKRKSSVSSVDEDLANISKDNIDKDDPLAIEEPLPPKKLRLETTPESDINATHSKDISEVKDAASDGKEDAADETKDDLNDSISKRKKIKAHKGKFKRKQKNKEIEKNDEKINDRNKKGSKSLKRSLVEATMSDKNKSESQSDSENDEPLTSGKRLKIKPKKIITSTRKKIEAKLQEKLSTDESEEETLYSLAGKKTTTPKKVVKKKKIKSKDSKDKKSKPDSDDSDTPVRQSRRIAQQKIKEEAERRHLEEVALRELKMIHKKKGKDDDDEEEWRASGRGSSSEEDRKRKHRKTWRTSDSTGPEPDSDSDSPLFELQAEPEPDYDKSDHEFSPESDLEAEEPAEPVKRARTLQEEKDDGFCKQCGSGEQPEWILLCDKCDAGYHASCLKPLLFYIPQGDWFCPPCNHEKLISSLESELVKFDELVVKVEEERARKKLEEPEPPPEQPKEEKKGSDEDESDSSCSTWSSASSGGVYRLRARRQLPVSMRAQEYDRLISAAIKEEYVEPTTSAGNQGRGKDISTIIEAAEEEKMKAEREAIEQGKPVELKKSKKKQRKKPRKLNSLEIPSEDDDEVDEDFKDTGAASSSEDISSSADKDSGTDSPSSDSLPIRRTGRSENKKDRPKMTESSPETKKKKKGIFEDSSSESAGAKEWSSASKQKSKPSHHHRHKDRSKKRDKSKKSRRSRGLTQYDAEGNVIRARVTYGGLSGDEGENDWSPKHRTRQKKINYTEMPNTESEDEMHKSSGKHMPDSSDEFKVTDTSDSDWDAEQKKKDENSERMKALNDLVKKTAVVPLEKLPEDVTKAKTEELQAHLNAQAANATPRPLRGKGSRGGRGSRGPRGRGGRGGGSTRSGSPQTDDALAKLVGVKVKELGPDGALTKPNQVEREKKRQEREAKQAEKEAKRQERLQKKEEKEKLKEQKAKEREEKKLAKIALQESKRIKKEKEYAGPMVGYGPPPGAMGGEMFQQRPPAPYHDQRFPNPPRLQVRAELRGMLAGEDRGSHSQQHNALREGTLSVAGSPQPFKPVSEEPSIITRMPHMINQQYRGPMMYPNNSGYGPRGPQNMYQLHPGLGGPSGAQGGQPRQFPPQYYRLPPYGGARPERPHPPYRHHMQGPPGPPTSMHHPGPPGSMHHPPGYGYRGPPPTSMPQGMSDRPGASPNPPSHLGGPSSLTHLTGPNSHPQNLGPPTTIGGPGGPGMPSHLGPGHLGGPPSHLNQLGRPPGMNPLGAPNSLGHSSHDGPNSHGGQPNSLGSPIPHGPPRPLGPNTHSGSPIHGPPNPLGPRHPLEAPGNPLGPNSHGGPRNLEGPRGLDGPQNPQGVPMNRASPAAGTSGMKHGAPGMTGAPGPPSQDEPPIKIKAEVKTEPEYRSPPTSPGESISGASTNSRVDEVPRHPKIKHTENKDRRPRFPLGPYAPHYAPFGPYAPHYAPEAHHTLQQYLSAERPRSPAPTADGSPRPYLPPHLRPYPRPPHSGSVPTLPSHSHHPMPNQGLPPGTAVSNGSQRPPSPRLAHPREMPSLPSAHPMAQPPPLHRPPSHHRLPSPLVAHHPRPVLPPQAHSQTPTTTHATGLPMQAHLTPSRSPLRSPGPLRRQSLTPPQNPPLHQPYAQQTQILQAPSASTRPTPPPALAQSPSPHSAHVMSHPLAPPARTPPNLAHHMPAHERASPNVPVPYQYAERRPLLPQPIPRDSLPPQSPPRREFERPEPQRREFERVEPQRREFEHPESQRREFEHPEPQRREFEHPEPQRREFEHPEPQRREFEHPESQRREFERPEPQRREFGHPEPQRREFEHPEPHRREFERPEPQRREFKHPEPQRREFEHPEPQRREFEHPEPQRREFEHPEPQRREFEHPEPQRREFEHPEPQCQDFERPEQQRPEPLRRDFESPESRREFSQPGSRDFETPESPKEIPQQAEADSTIAIKTEPMLGTVKEEPNREEGSVFGGLVSYFSSQHEDDMDA